MSLNKKMFFSFIFILFFTGSQSVLARLLDLKLEQLDPHGSHKNELKTMSIDQHTECKVCHYKKEENLQLKPHMQQRCVSCHNPFPHSGVIEHIGRGKLECLSCHRPHRAILDNAAAKKYERHGLSHLDEIEGAPSFLKIEKDQRKLPPGLVERSKSEVMLRRTCTDCHQWGAKK